MDNFLNRLAPRPSDYGGLPGKITREDDAGNVYDESGRKIFNKFDTVDQPNSWLDTAISTATAPAKLATALVGSLNPYGQDGWRVPPIISEPAAAFARSGESTGFGDDGQFYLPNVQNPQVAQDTLTQLMTVYGGNALNPLGRAKSALAGDASSIGLKDYAKAAAKSAMHYGEPTILNGMPQQFRSSVNYHMGHPKSPWSKDHGNYASLSYRDKDGFYLPPSNELGDPVSPSEAGYMNALMRSNKERPSFGIIDGGLLSDNRPSLMGSALASMQDNAARFTIDKLDGEYAAMTPDGDMMGNFIYEETPQAAFVLDASVKPEYRRQGVASTVYGAIQDDLGKPLTPDVKLTNDGYSFWKANYPEAVREHVYQDGYWVDPMGYIPDEVPGWRLAGGPNRPEGVLWSDNKPSLLGSALASGHGEEDLMALLGYR